MAKRKLIKGATVKYRGNDTRLFVIADIKEPDYDTYFKRRYFLQAVDTGVAILHGVDGAILQTVEIMSTSEHRRRDRMEDAR